MERFLINGTVRKMNYMSKSNAFKDLKFVKAVDEESALARYSEWWEAKGSDYSTSYYVIESEVVETIE